MPSFYFFIYGMLTVCEMNVRLVAGELLLDPNRVRYAQLNVDVEVSAPTYQIQQAH
jgi:hypothetical protein